MNDIISAVQQHLTASAAQHPADCWRLLYCVQGRFALRAEQHELACSAGDMALIPPDMAYSISCADGADCLCLDLANAALAVHHPAVLQDDGNHSILHLLEDVHYLFHHGGDRRDLLLPAYGQLLAQHVNCRRPASPRTQVVEEIAQSIQQNFANPNYELDELLRSAPYCYDYLCRLFRQEMHTTPHKYLTDLRLQCAAGILRAGGASITEAARMSGYLDPLYFSRMFKKKFGVSPREYGRNAK